MSRKFEDSESGLGITLTCDMCGAVSRVDIPNPRMELPDGFTWPMNTVSAGDSDIAEVCDDCTRYTVAEIVALTKVTS